MPNTHLPNAVVLKQGHSASRGTFVFVQGQFLLSELGRCCWQLVRSQDAANHPTVRGTALLSPALAHTQQGIMWPKTSIVPKGLRGLVSNKLSVPFPEEAGVGRWPETIRPGMKPTMCQLWHLPSPLPLQLSSLPFQRDLMFLAPNPLPGTPWAIHDSLYVDPFPFSFWKITNYPLKSYSNARHLYTYHTYPCPSRQRKLSPSSRLIIFYWTDFFSFFLFSFCILEKSKLLKIGHGVFPISVPKT